MSLFTIHLQRIMQVNWKSIVSKRIIYSLSFYTTGSQKVPGMVVLHCNGKKYGNAYQILERTHARTPAPSILPLSEAPAKGLFWNLLEFSRGIRFDALHGCEICPLRPIFRVGNSHSERDPESAVVGWWQECLPRQGIAAQQAVCGSVRYRVAAATCRAVSSELHRPTSARLARREDQ
jgi:hypothetical protein